MTDHEGHFFGGSIFGCKDEIALVLAGDRVEDDDKFTVRCNVQLVNHPFHFRNELDGWSKGEGERGQVDPSVRIDVIPKALMVSSIPSKCNLAMPSRP